MDIRVGYKDFKIKFIEDLNDRAEAVGMCFKQKGIIEIEKSLIAVEMANTLMHEVLHAIHYVHGLSEMGQDENSEERIVNSLANGLTQVFRDNPEFTSLVMSKLDYEVLEGDDEG